MTSAEKFDTNIYGFAWFEAESTTKNWGHDHLMLQATPCRDHVCEGASLQAGLVMGWRLEESSPSSRPYAEGFRIRV